MTRIIHRVLIANRGEIAVRIMRTLKEMAIESVAVYHQSESNALHTTSADISISLGQGSIEETFLNIDKLISIARQNNCDAIHPGYGFLSENFRFAEACEKNGVIFIGPKSEVIKKMGLKSEAKRLAAASDVPILKSTSISSQSIPYIVDGAYPLLVKAIAGGGGKGMQIVYRSEDLEQAVLKAEREAEQYFANKELMLEPYLENARHIEVQILADNHGNVAHLYERECSIQRNNQKLIEEAPAVSISDKLRKNLHETSVRLAKDVNYTNAGTIEFLVSGEKFYFLEMNTRIQVEHPVTEQITGLDLVREQIHIAQGKSLTNEVLNAKCVGHSIEVRVCAEDAYNNFVPSAGYIHSIHLPINARSEIFTKGNEVLSGDYDSLIAKIVVTAENRAAAIKDMQEALDELSISGITTNQGLLAQILKEEEYLNNLVSTSFLENSYHSLKEQYIQNKSIIEPWQVIAAYLSEKVSISRTKKSLWYKKPLHLLNRDLFVFIDGEVYKYFLLKADNNEIHFQYNKNNYKITIGSGIGNKTGMHVADSTFYATMSRTHNENYLRVYINNCLFKVQSWSDRGEAGALLKKQATNSTKSFNQISSPLFGKVTDVRVSPKDNVSEGDILLTIESMKTENNILAPGSGVVKEILIEKGSRVQENTRLITLDVI